MDRAEMKYTVYGILLFLFFLLLTACPNFMQGNEVKDVIKAEVAEANAPEVTVRVQPLSSEMGSTTPSGPTTVKVGIPFDVEMSANPEYAFIGWDSPSEIITFDNYAASETTVVASQIQEDILVVANYDSRPKVITHEPFSQDGVLMNQKVTIVFSEDVDPETLNFDNVSVVAKRRNTTDETTDMSARLKDPVVSGSNVELQFEGSNTYDAQNQVVISLSKAITDLDGHEMAEDFSWSFITGSSTDLSIPAINNYYLIFDVDEDGVKDDPDDITHDNPTTLIITKYNSMRIEVDASDDVSVETIRISESAMNDAGDTVLSTADDLWQSDYFGTDYEYTYDLRTSGDGRKRLRITVLDPPQQESNYKDIEIALDTTAPSVSGLVLNGGNQYIDSHIDVPISVTVTDPGYSSGVGAGMGGYAVTTTDTEPGSWTTATSPPSQITLPSSAQGPQTIFFHAKDSLGNWNGSFMQATITIDSDEPSISAVTINSGNTYSTTQNVDYSFTYEDNGSGIAQYQVKAVNQGATGVTPDAGGWTVLGTPLIGSDTVSGSVNVPAGDGNKTVYIWVDDAAGNRSVDSTGSVTLDENGPDITTLRFNGIDPGAETISTKENTVNLSFDLSDAGAGNMEYQIGVTPPGGVETVKTAWTDTGIGDSQSESVNLTNYNLEGATYGDGIYTVKVEARDELGNEATFVEGNITRDTAQPTITGFDINEGDTLVKATNLEVDFTIADSGSGLAGYWVSDDDGTYSGDWTGISGAGPTTINNYLVAVNGDGSKTIKVKVKDAAENEDEVSGTIEVDNTAPTISAGTLTLQNYDPVNSSYTNGVVDLSFTAEDAGIGINASNAATYEVTYVDSTSTTQTLGTGTTTDGTVLLTNKTLTNPDTTVSFSITLTDALGNSDTYSGGSLTYDGTAPTISAGTLTLQNHDPVNDSYTDGVVDLSFTVEDAGIGISASNAATYEVTYVDSTTTTQTLGTGTTTDGTVSLTNKTLNSPATTVSFSITLTDALGNSDTYSGGSLTYDGAAPALGSTTPEATYNSGESRMELTVYGNETGSGVKQVKFWPDNSGSPDEVNDSVYIDLDSATTGANTVTNPSPVVLTGLGDENFYFRLVDAVGNEMNTAKSMTESGGTYTNLTTRGSGPDVTPIPRSGGTGGQPAGGQNRSVVLATSSWNKPLQVSEKGDASAAVKTTRRKNVSAVSRSDEISEDGDKDVRPKENTASIRRPVEQQPVEDVPREAPKQPAASKPAGRADRGIIRGPGKTEVPDTAEQLPEPEWVNRTAAGLTVRFAPPESPVDIALPEGVVPEKEDGPEQVPTKPDMWVDPRTGGSGKKEWIDYGVEL